MTSPTASSTSSSSTRRVALLGPPVLAAAAVMAASAAWAGDLRTALVTHWAGSGVGDGTAPLLVFAPLMVLLVLGVGLVPGIGLLVALGLLVAGGALGAVLTPAPTHEPTLLGTTTTRVQPGEAVVWTGTAAPAGWLLVMALGMGVLGVVLLVLVDPLPGLVLAGVAALLAHRELATR